MVINGEKQIAGSDRAALLSAVQDEEEHASRMTIRILSTQAVRDGWKAHYSVKGELPAGGADLMAVLVDNWDRSSVLHGENSGRTLVHVAVARSISRVGKLEHSGKGEVKISIPELFQGSQPQHLILFVQVPRNGRVLGTATEPVK